MTTMMTGIVDAANFGGTYVYAANGAGVNSSKNLACAATSTGTSNANIVSVNGTTFGGSKIPAGGTITGSISGFVQGSGGMTLNSSGGSGNPTISASFDEKDVKDDKNKDKINVFSPLRLP